MPHLFREHIYIAPICITVTHTIVRGHTHHTHETRSVRNFHLTLYMALLLSLHIHATTREQVQAPSTRTRITATEHKNIPKSTHPKIKRLFEKLQDTKLFLNLFVKEHSQFECECERKSKSEFKHEYKYKQ